MSKGQHLTRATVLLVSVLHYSPFRKFQGNHKAGFLYSKCFTHSFRNVVVYIFVELFVANNVENYRRNAKPLKKYLIKFELKQLRLTLLFWFTGNMPCSIEDRSGKKSFPLRAVVFLSTFTAKPFTIDQITWWRRKESQILVLSCRSGVWQLASSRRMTFFTVFEIR